VNSKQYSQTSLAEEMRAEFGDAEYKRYNRKYQAHLLQQERERKVADQPAGYDESTNPSNGWRCPRP
jgi:hypothetical protein